MISNFVEDFHKSLSEEDLIAKMNFFESLSDNEKTEVLSKFENEKLLLLNEISLSKFKRTIFDISNDEWKSINDCECNNKKSSCPRHYYPKHTNHVNWSKTNQYPSSIYSAGNVADTDCDYEIKFYVGPQTMASPLSIGANSPSANLLLMAGGINFRQSGNYVYLLIGKGKADALCYPQNPTFYLKQHLRIKR